MSHTFTGRRFDEENGMYHFHFRQYDPATGVWTTPDPLGILGGINFYGYVGNNPVNFWDWLGLTLSAGEAGVGNPGSYGGENTPDSMGGTNGTGTGNTHGSDSMSKEEGEAIINNNPELAALRCEIRAYGEAMELDEMMSDLRKASLVKDLLDPGIRTGLLDEGLDFAEAAQLGRIGQAEKACKDKAKK